MKDEKILNAKRDKIKVLVNGNKEILWVIGHRSDERYRISKETNKICKLSYSEQS
jgi:tRNA(Ile)-lysidine synthase